MIPRVWFQNQMYLRFGCNRTEDRKHYSLCGLKTLHFPCMDWKILSGYKPRFVNCRLPKYVSRADVSLPVEREFIHPVILEPLSWLDAIKPEEVLSKVQFFGKTARLCFASVYVCRFSIAASFFLLYSRPFQSNPLISPFGVKVNRMVSGLAMLRVTHVEGLMKSR